MMVQQRCSRVKLRLTRALRLTAFAQMLRTSQCPETLYDIGEQIS